MSTDTTTPTALWPLMSDAALLALIEESSHWDDVFTRCTGKPSPGGSTRQAIRERVKRLQVSTAHLNKKPGPKRLWTDDDLRTAVTEEANWDAVYRRLRAGRDQVRARCADLELNTRHLDDANLLQPVETPGEHLSIDPARLRQAAESAAIHWYTLRGFDVFTPAPGLSTRADFIVSRGKHATYVQVKSATKRTTTGYFEARLTYGSRSNLGDRTYSAEEIDEFFIVTADETYYRVPLTTVEGLSRVTLGPKYDALRVSERAPV